MCVETSSEMCAGEETDASSLIRVETVAVTGEARGAGPSSRTRWSSATISKTTDVTDLSAGSSTAPQMWRQSSISQVVILLLTSSHHDASCLIIAGYLPPAVRDQVIHKGVAVDFPATNGGVPICKDYLKVDQINFFIYPFHCFDFDFSKMSKPSQLTH